MLALLILWAILGLAFYVVGTSILYRFKLQTCLPQTEDRIFVGIWLGIVVLGILLLFVSLFTPLTWFVELSIIAALSIPYFFQKHEPFFKGLSINLATSLCLLVALLWVAFGSTASLGSALSAIYGDTALYHYQVVKWLSEYGSVPGLALIHERFGNTSSWFALAAPLQIGTFKDLFMVGMNSFVFCLMLFQAVMALSNIFYRRAKINDWFYMFAFMAILLVYGRTFSIVQSVSPDLPNTFLILVVAWLIITISSSGRITTNVGARWPGAVVLILALGAVLVKLSAVPLLCVAVIYYVFAAGFSLRTTYVAVALTALFILVLMLVSTTTSGCPFYPAPYFCTDLPWSLGSGVAKSISNQMNDWARWGGHAPTYATNLNWIWRGPLSRDRILMLGLLTANIFCISWLCIKRHHPISKSIFSHFYILFIALAGCLFSLAMAPALRFILGYLLILPSLTCASFFQGLSNTDNWTESLRKLKMLFLLIAVFFIIMPIINYYLFTQPDVISDNAWSMVIKWPAAPIKIPPLVQKQSHNFTYFHPSKPDIDVCSGAPIPCAPSIIGGDIWLRDEKSGFSRGFFKKPPH